MLWDLHAYFTDHCTVLNWHLEIVLSNCMKAKGRDGGGFILKKKTFNTPILYKQELSEKPFKNTHISNFPTLKLWKVDTLPQETFQSTLPHTVLCQEHKTK